VEAFWLSFAMIFLAELGDKTQLVAMCLACRYNARVVLAGVFVATLVVHVFSVLIGGSVGKFLSQDWINLTAGLAFVGFGLWTLRGDEIDDETCGATKVRSPFLLVATTFFLAELGDKTMLSTVTLATSYQMIPVWIGSTLGMVVSDGLAIIVGQMLGKRLPERAIKFGAALIFFGFGLYSGVKGALALQEWGIIIGAAVTLAMLAWFLVQMRKDAGRMQKAATIELEATLREPAGAGSE